MYSAFSPLSLKSITLKNRFVVSPMCQYSSIDGFANDWHLVHLGSHAVGGSALVFTEAAAVSPEGRISPDDLGIWKDEHIEFLKRITSFIESQNAVPAIQLAHAGRKASHNSPWKGNNPITLQEGGWQTLSSSGMPYKPTDPAPREMSKEQIKKAISDFKNAAKRALHAGFKILEIHAAHGYLINNFLSPLSNNRTDEYGGEINNRCRFLLEIINGVKEDWPGHLPLFVRVSASEWIAGGWSIEDSIFLAQLLKQNGVDLIDCSSGGNSPDQKIPVGPMYQVPFAERIKRETEILTGSVGMITSMEEAESILKENKADLIFMARQLLREPYLPLHAAKRLNVLVKWPPQYERAQ